MPTVARAGSDQNPEPGTQSLEWEEGTQLRDPLPT